ncbi:MAG: DUF4404 family protein [Chloroflexota bacterium]
MDNQELDKLLERLHEELEGAEHVDDKGRDLLRQLDADIHSLLGQPEAEEANPWMAVARQLKDAINHLEATHPRLTAVLSDMVNSLSNAGI